jgi:hypothetical protein
VLVKLNFPIEAVYLSFKSSIELEVATRLKVRCIPFEKYLKPASVPSLTFRGTPSESPMLSGVKDAAVKRFIKNSKLIHGVEMPDGSIRVHPDKVFKDIASKFIKVIKKELRKR